MGNGILDSSKYTVHPHKSPALHLLHLLSLLSTSVIIGILFVVLSKTPSLAKTTPKQNHLTYIPIPKATIAHADIQGTPAPQNAPQTPSQPAAVTTTPPDNAEPITSTITPSATPAASLNADLVFSMVNQIRQQNGLPPFQKDDRLCSLAASRAPEVNNEIATGTMHQGMYARNLPYWNNENIVSFNSESAAVNFWMSDSVHKDAILGDTQYSCVACSANACAEEFSNFKPK